MTARTWTIDLPWTRPPLHLNQRLHWAARHRLTTAVHDAVQWQATAQRLPRGLDAVVIVLHWQPTVVRRRDTDNPTPTLKAAIDALTRYGLTPDDDYLHVASHVEIMPTAATARLWLTVTETQPAEVAQ